MSDRIPLTLGRSYWAIDPLALPPLIEGRFDSDELRLMLESRLDQPQVSKHDQRGNKKGAVAVLPLQGVITPQPSLLSLLFGGGGGLSEFRDNFRAALADDDVGSIVLDINSPGGSIHGISEMAEEVRAARGEKPIVAVANHMAASAAYWIGVQADEFVVAPDGAVGSIGVYMVHADMSGALEQEGIKPTYTYAGKYKVEGNPDEPLSDEAKADRQKDVDLLYGKFVDAVAQARGVSDAEVRSGYGEGRVLIADRALEEGLVDRIGSVESEVGRLIEAGRGASNATEAVQITNVTTSGQNFRIEFSNGAVAEHTVTEVPEDEPQVSENSEDVRALLDLEFAE